MVCLSHMPASQWNEFFRWLSIAMAKKKIFFKNPFIIPKTRQTSSDLRLGVFLKPLKTVYFAHLSGTTAPKIIFLGIRSLLRHNGCHKSPGCPTKIRTEKQDLLERTGRVQE